MRSLDLELATPPYLVGPCTTKSGENPPCSKKTKQTHPNRIKPGMARNPGGLKKQSRSPGARRQLSPYPPPSRRARASRHGRRRRLVLPPSRSPRPDLRPPILGARPPPLPSGLHPLARLLHLPPRRAHAPVGPRQPHGSVQISLHRRVLLLAPPWRPSRRRPRPA